MEDETSPTVCGTVVRAVEMDGEILRTRYLPACQCILLVYKALRQNGWLE